MINIYVTKLDRTKLLNKRPKETSKTKRTLSVLTCSRLLLNISKIQVTAVGSIPVAVTQNSDIVPVLSKEFLDIGPITEWGYTLNVYVTWHKHTDNFQNCLSKLEVLAH